MARETKPGLIELGMRIKALRKSLHLTQREFARKLGISGSFISEVEAGKTKPGYDFIKNLSAHYAVNFDYLFYGKGEMLNPGKLKARLGNKGIGEGIETLEELLWYIENSPLFMHTIIGFATKFLYENEVIIKKDIDRSTSDKGEEEKK